MGFFTCSKCGAKISPDANYCSNCGTAFNSNVNTAKKRASKDLESPKIDNLHTPQGTVTIPSGYEKKHKDLAERWKRLVAILFDLIAGILVMVPMTIIAIMIPKYFPEIEGSTAVTYILLSMLCPLGLGIYQIFLLTTIGQTIGKRYMNVQIVRYGDQSNPGFLRAVVLRSVVPGLIIPIPYVGVIFFLLDILFIFNKERRCIHDFIAGTQVINV